MSIDPLDFLEASESSSSQNPLDPLGFLGEDVSRARSIASAPAKGLIRGAQKFSPLPSFGPIPNKLKQRVLEHFLPTQDKPLENVLEFTAEHAPLAALGEGGLISKGIQAAGGGLAKTAAKAMQLPEWAQDIIGGIGMAAPAGAKAAASSTLKPSKSQTAITKFLRDKGFSDSEITPIIQDKKKLSWLSKGAMKYEEKNPWLKGIQEKLGGLYEDVRAKGQTQNFLQGKNLRDFEKKFHNIADKLPRRHRRLAEPEIKELFDNPINFSSLQDFNIAVNDIIKAATGGKASIGKLKEATHEAQRILDAPLFKEVRQIDEAYSKLMNYTDKMTTKNWQNLINLGQAGHALYGFLTLNPMAIKTAGLAAAGRFSLRQVLSNPRLQNVHAKLWDAFLKNRMQEAMKLAGIFAHELSKEKSD